MPKIVDLTEMTLGVLSEGTFGQVIETEMARITRDLEERGTDMKPRRLTIQIDVKFDPAQKRYIIKPSCQSRLPPQQARPTQAELEFNPASKNYVLQFNPNSAVKDQSTINDELHPEGDS